MSRFHSYLNSAASILSVYKGDQPFNIFLKSYFGQHKKYGSRDRKQISALCYSYLRLGNAMQDLSIEERLLAGFFACQQQPTDLLEALKPEWNEVIALPHNEKFRILNSSIEDIFPWNQELSNGIQYDAFATSLLIQPDLYLRLRPAQEDNVKQKLNNAGINFNQVNSHCLSLENAVQVDNILTLDKEAVVQDYNSQRIAEFFECLKDSRPLSIYDCCAASGGKSILAYDVMDEIDLVVSDIRESILINLKKRFERAGIKNYTAFVENLSTPNRKLPPDRTMHQIIQSVVRAGKTENRKPSSFDLVICDAPCSGSGTWSRTPEQLYYFHPERIDYYSNLQKSILENVVPLIKNAGHLLYITCSVFKKENEDVVAYLENNFKLKIQKMELLKGYDKKADTLFAALLQV